MKQSRTLWGVILLAAVLLLAGCAAGNPAETTLPPETSSALPETTLLPTGTTELIFTLDGEFTTIPPPETTTEDENALSEPSGINHLTGLPLPEGTEAKRPLAVVINNLKLALPQAGIAEADVIFEVEAEENITRLIAVFTDPGKAGKIGPVRSTRSAFVNIAAGLDGIMVHAGGSPQSYTDIKNLSLPSVDGIYDTATFYRDQGRISSKGYEHSMYTSGTRLANKYAALAKGGLRTALRAGYAAPFAFYETDTTPEGGTPCVKVTALYGSYQPRFSYQQSTGIYLRYEYGAAHMDEGSNTQLAFKNVIVLSVPSSRIPGDDAMRRQFQDVGSGTGIYATNGTVVPVKWSKAGAAKPLVLTDSAGNPLRLNPGKTFISYVNGTANIKTE